MKSKETRQSTRNGFRAMWRHAPELMEQFGVPKPETFDTSNLHGGVMWGSMQEWRNNKLSEDQILEIVFEVYTSGASVSVCKQVRKTCSYLYHLDTGIPGKNWPGLPGVVGSVKVQLKPPKNAVMPEHVPTAADIVKAFTNNWKPNPTMSLMTFMVNCLLTWDSHVLGSRPNSDLDKIKKSTDHWWDFKNKCWTTSFVAGRSKLALQKSGTRPWRAWRICMCPNEEHIEPPENFEFSFDENGNTNMDISNLCTTCPLFIGQFLKRAQEPLVFRCYRKYIYSESRKKRSRSPWSPDNYGDLQTLVIEWLKHQGVTPVSRNSGRKTLARLSEATKSTYPELVHVMGDLEPTWRKRYQPGLPPSGGYKIREQSLDPEVACAYLRRFRKLCGRNRPPQPPPPGMSKDALMMFLIAKRLGLENDAREIYSEL